MERIIEFAFCSITAIVCLVVGIMQINERGIPLNNGYLDASEEKKKSMNKTPYYRQSGIVFIMLSVIFALISAAVAFQTELLSYLALGVCAAVVIYAIVSAVIIEKSAK